MDLVFKYILSHEKHKFNFKKEKIQTLLPMRIKFTIFLNVETE